VSGWDLTDDDVLLGLLRGVVDEIDPVPPDVIGTALAAFDMFRVDDELATLVADSLVDGAVLVRRDAGAERLLTFTAPAASIEIGLPPDGDTLFGAIVPPAATVVEIESASDTIMAMSDELGRFHAEVGPGRCRLRVRAGGSAIVTPWIVR